jgi:hypothetical protein
MEADFHLAKVLNANEVEVSLIALTETEDRGLYCVNLRQVWSEPITMVYHCDVTFDESTRLYKLHSKKEEIVSLLD